MLFQKHNEESPFIITQLKRSLSFPSLLITFSEVLVCQVGKGSYKEVVKKLDIEVVSFKHLNKDLRFWVKL